MPEPRSSESPKPPSWSEWKARNGSKLWCWRAPLAVEWALEWFVYRLRGLALFDLLELIGKLTVVVAVIFWFLEADDRTKERHRRTWALINSVRGSSGEVHLAGAPLERAHLAGIDLSRAFLLRANLQDANLQNADLRDANLQDANLQNADLRDADLRRANLRRANLQNVDLRRANLQNADLWVVKLQGADLRYANFQGADLTSAKLAGTHLQDADFRDAYLLCPLLPGGADLAWSACGLTQEQLDNATGNDRTLLPDGLTRPAHWSKAEVPEGQPSAQPDDAREAPATAGAPGPEK